MHSLDYKQIMYSALRNYISHRSRKVQKLEITKKIPRSYKNLIAQPGFPNVSDKNHIKFICCYQIFDIPCMLSKRNKNGNT
jgi:hypothetical protein